MCLLNQVSPARESFGLLVQNQRLGRLVAIEGDLWNNRRLERMVEAERNTNPQDAIEVFGDELASQEDEEDTSNQRASFRSTQCNYLDVELSKLIIKNIESSIKILMEILRIPALKFASLNLIENQTRHSNVHRASLNEDTLNLLPFDWWRPLLNREEDEQEREEEEEEEEGGGGGGENEFNLNLISLVERENQANRSQYRNNNSNKMIKLNLRQALWTSFCLNGILLLLCGAWILMNSIQSQSMKSTQSESFYAIKIKDTLASSSLWPSFRPSSSSLSSSPEAPRLVTLSNKVNLNKFALFVTKMNQAKTKVHINDQNNLIHESISYNYQVSLLVTLVELANSLSWHYFRRKFNFFHHSKAQIDTDTETNSKVSSFKEVTNFKLMLNVTLSILISPLNLFQTIHLALILNWLIWPEQLTNLSTFIMLHCGLNQIARHGYNMYRVWCYLLILEGKLKAPEAKHDDELRIEFDRRFLNKTNCKCACLINASRQVVISGWSNWPFKLAECQCKFRASFRYKIERYLLLSQMICLKATIFALLVRIDTLGMLQIELDVFQNESVALVGLVILGFLSMHRLCEKYNLRYNYYDKSYVQ